MLITDQWWILFDTFFTLINIGVHKQLFDGAKILILKYF